MDELQLMGSPFRRAVICKSVTLLQNIPKSFALKLSVTVFEVTEKVKISRNVCHEVVRSHLGRICIITKFCAVTFE